MKNDRVDKILDLIDNSLQSSGETGFLSTVPEGHCTKCKKAKVENGAGFCKDCRDYLLGDSDIDPAAGVEYEDSLMSGYYAYYGGI